MLVTNQTGNLSAAKQGEGSGPASINPSHVPNEGGAALQTTRGFGSLIPSTEREQRLGQHEQDGESLAEMLSDALQQESLSGELVGFVRTPYQAFGAAGATNAAINGEQLGAATNPMMTRAIDSERMSFNQLAQLNANSTTSNATREGAASALLQTTTSLSSETTSKSLASDIASLLSASQSQSSANSALAGAQSAAPQTQATLTTMANVTTTEWAPVRIDPQAGKWGEQMLQVLHDRVTLQAQQNLQEARIRLDPPDLGKLDLMVRVEGDKLSVQLNANVAATREALIQVSERLRAELQNQSLMHVDVQIGSGDKQESDAHPSHDQSATIFANQRHDAEHDAAMTFSTDEHWLNTQV